MTTLFITANLAISLDGKIEGANAEFDWCFTDQDYGLKKFISHTNLIICGGNSYRMLCAHNVNLTQEFGHVPWVVFTSKECKNQPGVTITKQPPEIYLQELDDGKAKNIWLFGGAKLFQHLINQKLVHAIQLAIHPIILGSGKTFFENIDSRIYLELIDCQHYNTGLLQTYYKVIYGNKEEKLD